MTVVIPTASGADFLRLILGQQVAHTWMLRLFTNDHTPTADDDGSEYVEASGSGYSPIPLAVDSWTIAAGPPSTARYALQTFTFTGPLGNVYGYYLTDASTGALQLAERFPANVTPFIVRSAVDQIKISPLLQRAC